MEDAQAFELTDADLNGEDRIIVERAKLILELATAIAATPDQVYPLARILALAQIAEEIATARFDY